MKQQHEDSIHNGLSFWNHVHTTCKLWCLMILIILQKGFSPPSPRQAALMAVDQYNADDRRTGITLLSTSSFGGAPDYLEMYRDYVIKDRDPLVRAASMKALARFGTPEDALLIFPWLDRSKEESSQVRRAASIALQRLHNASVVPALLRSLRDQDEENQVRASVATALGQYPENQVFIGLVASLQANDLSINLSAAQSLHTLTVKCSELIGMRGMNGANWQSNSTRIFLPVSQCMSIQRINMFHGGGTI